jgi:hypothetical protein
MSDDDIINLGAASKHRRRMHELTVARQDAREVLLETAELVAGWPVDDDALRIALGKLDDAVRAVIAASAELAEEEGRH